MSTTREKITGSILYIFDDADAGWKFQYELDYEATPGEQGEPPEPYSDFRSEDAPDACDITGAVLTSIDTAGVCDELDETEWGLQPHAAYGEMFGRAFIARYHQDPEVKEQVDAECFEHAGLRA